MKYQVSHKTLYDYQSRVFLSHNQGYFEPRQVPGQRCLRKRLWITPEPAVQTVHLDYYGNPFTFFAVQEPHLQLEVLTKFTIELNPASPPESSPAWDSRGTLELEVMEFVYPSRLCPALPQLRDYASTSFPPGRSLLDGALDLNLRIYEEFSFDPTATTVSTPVSDVFVNKRGVCQDFAHLLIACLRSLELPARYVSGYLRTIPPPGKPRLEGADASHAWVDLYLPGFGWLGLDPTNNCVAATDHVVLAWGRDYQDVCPLRGVVLGGGEQTVHVAVDVVESD